MYAYIWALYNRVYPLLCCQQVPINTVNTDSTIADNTTTINTTDSLLLITQVEVLSAEFLSESDAGIVYIQVSVY